MMRHSKRTATYCNMLQCYNTLYFKQTILISSQSQHAYIYCNTLQYAVTHCNMLHFERVVSISSQLLHTYTSTHCNALHHNATHCDTLRHTATHCDTLRHTATHCSSNESFRLAANRSKTVAEEGSLRQVYVFLCLCFCVSVCLHMFV